MESSTVNSLRWVDDRTRARTRTVCRESHEITTSSTSSEVYVYRRLGVAVELVSPHLFSTTLHSKSLLQFFFGDFLGDFLGDVNAEVTHFRWRI